MAIQSGAEDFRRLGQQIPYHPPQLPRQPRGGAPVAVLDALFQCLLQHVGQTLGPRKRRSYLLLKAMIRPRTAAAISRPRIMNRSPRQS